MYAYLRGEIAEVGVDTAVVDVGGVGYEFAASRSTLSELRRGRDALIYTHLHIAQDAVALFGFATKEERVMFRRLIGVTRVGPKLALSTLSVLSCSELAACIVTENETALARTPGMGKKTAQRIILELKEKIATEEAIAVPSAAALTGNAAQEAAAALIALGYDPTTAQRAIAQVADQSEATEELLKLALKGLARF